MLEPDPLRLRLQHLAHDHMVRVDDSVQAIARDALAALDAYPPVFPPGAPARAAALRHALRIAHGILTETDGDDRAGRALHILATAIEQDTDAYHQAQRAANTRARKKSSAP